MSAITSPLSFIQHSGVCNKILNNYKLLGKYSSLQYHSFKKLAFADSLSCRFNIQQFYLLPTQCIYVFCVDVRTSSDYFFHTALNDPSPWYLYLVEGHHRVRGPAWPNDPKSYASGSISYW